MTPADKMEHWFYGGLVGFALGSVMAWALTSQNTAWKSDLEAEIGRCYTTLQKSLDSYDEIVCTINQWDCADADVAEIK